MRTATFIERARQDQKIAHTVKKEIPWQDSFNELAEGSVFEAEFGGTGKSMDFKIINIVRDYDPLGLGGNVTFWMEQAEKQPELDKDDVPF